MLLNNSVKYKYLMRPGNGGHTVIPVPQIGKLPHTINYQSIYLSIHLFYAGTIISNNLPHSVGIPKNDKAKFKATYTTILHGRWIFCVRRWFIILFCKMRVVFYTVNLYICVFMTCSRSYCFHDTLKADSHITCRALAAPLPCRAAKGLECVFPIRFTQCGPVWFTLAMTCPCHVPTMPFFSRPKHNTTVTRWPCCAVLCRGLEKNGMVGTWHRQGMASVNQTRPHCVNRMGKTHYKPLAAQHARGKACYVWIGLN